MQHLTLNTNNIEEFLPPLFFLDCEVLLSADRIKEKQLDEPYDRYSIESIFFEDGFVYFDLYLDEEHITANIVAIKNLKCLDLLVDLYQQIYGYKPALTQLNLPCLVTLVLPTEKIFESQLAARIEQSIALSIINHA